MTILPKTICTIHLQHVYTQQNMHIYPMDTGGHKIYHPLFFFHFHVKESCDVAKTCGRISQPFVTGGLCLIVEITQEPPFTTMKTEVPLIFIINHTMQVSSQSTVYCYIPSGVMNCHIIFLHIQIQWNKWLNKESSQLTLLTEGGTYTNTHTNKHTITIFKFSGLKDHNQTTLSKTI